MQESVFAKVIAKNLVEKWYQHLTRMRQIRENEYSTITDGFFIEMNIH